MDFSNLWKHCYRFTHAYFHTVWNNDVLGSHAPSIFRRSSHFALWEAVSQRIYCCSPKIKHLAPKQILGWLRHWATVSLHHLSKMSEVKSHMRKSALIIVTWSEPLKIRCHVVVTQQRATVEQCARKFRNVWVCRGTSGHEWTASSSLHHIKTVKLALVQCKWHAGKSSGIARIKSITHSRCWLQIYEKFLVLSS